MLLKKSTGTRWGRGYLSYSPCLYILVWSKGCKNVEVPHTNFIEVIKLQNHSLRKVLSHLSWVIFFVVVNIWIVNWFYWVITCCTQIWRYFHITYSRELVIFYKITNCIISQTRMNLFTKSVLSDSVVSNISVPYRKMKGTSGLQIIIKEYHYDF